MHLTFTARWKRLSALLGLLLVAAPVAAQPTLQVEAGLDRWYRAQRWMPVRLNLQNQGGPARVDVAVRFNEGQAEGDEARLAERVLQGSANQSHTLYLRVGQRYGSQPLQVDLNVDGRRVDRLSPASSMVPEGEWLVAGFGSGAASLKQLTAITLPAGKAPNPIQARMNGNNQPSRVNVAVLPATAAPDRWQGLDAADLVVLAGADERDFTPDQLTALRDYVSSGGRLVVTGGVNWNRFTTPFYRDLLPLRVTGGATAASLAEVGRFAGTAALPSGSIPLVAGAPKPGAQVHASSGGVPAIVSGRVGLGKVTFLAFDPAMPPLRTWQNLEKLWVALLAEDADQAPLVTQIGEGEGDYGYRGTTQFSNAPFSISQLDIPSFYIVALFLLSYIVILVPVNYFVLKARDKKEYAWLTTPLIVVAFTMGAYLIGYGFKGGQTLVVKVGVVEAFSGGDTGRSLTYSGVFSPRKTRYDVRLASGTPGSLAAATLLSEPQSFDRPKRLTSVQDEAQTIRDLDVDMWSMRVLRGDGLARFDRGIHAAISPSGVQRRLTVRNDSPFTLDDCRIVLGNQVVPLGTLTPGQSLTREIKLETYSKPGGFLPTSLLEGLRGTDPQSRVRRAVISPLTAASSRPQPASRAPVGGVGDPLLIGWIKEPLDTLQINGKPGREQSANLLLLHVASDAN